jgi:hypothetical protein
MPSFADLKNRVKEYAEERNLEEHKGFIFFVLEELMDLSPEEAENCVIDGPYDGGIDVVYFDEAERKLLLLQSKYTENIDGNTLESGVKDLIRGVRYILGEKNQVAPRLNAALNRLGLQSLAPYSDLSLKVVFVTTAKVGQSAEERRAKERTYSTNLNDFLRAKGVSFEADFEILDFRGISAAMGEFVGVDLAFEVVGQQFFTKPNKEAIVFTADASQIATFVQDHGEALFENNVRRFLGFRGNINKGIRRTLEDPSERGLFWYFNNGIVAVCEDFEFPTDGSSEIVFRNFSIVNGAQTASILKDVKAKIFTLGDVGVLMKVVNLSRISETDKIDLVSRITLAANSQNPTNTRDLRGVDRIQKLLEQRFKEFGYSYIRRRGVGLKKGSKTILMKDIAQAYTAFYLDEPYTAYARVNEIFGKNDYYERVFLKWMLDELDKQTNVRLSQYILSNRLLQLVRDKVRQDTSVLSLIYHILWALKQATNIDLSSLGDPEVAESYAQQIFGQKIEPVISASKLAITNLQTVGSGFDLPKDAKSKEGFERFKQAFHANYNQLYPKQKQAAH